MKFKVTTKGILLSSEDKSHENDRVTGGESKRFEVTVSVKPSMPVNSGKRKPQMALDGQRGKKQKLNRNSKLQLNKILKELMNDPVGWVFREPVDPVKLGIPDYFSIITKPMDLGTVQRKLEGNMYSGADEFADDVRLTFSNAMLYNPPGNKVHYWAKKLDTAFSKKWRLLEANLKRGNKNDEEASFIDYMGNNGQNAKSIVENNHQSVQPVDLNKAPLSVKIGSYRPMSLEEKKKFRLELVQALNRKMTEKLQTVFQKFGLNGLNKERLDSFVDLTDDETLWKFRREVKVLLGARDGEVKPGRIALNGGSLLNKTVEKERSSRSALASVEAANHRQSIDSTGSKCSLCVSLKCHCLRSGATQGYTSDISSERSSEHSHHGDSKPDCEVKYAAASLTSSFCLDSDGPGVVINEENNPHLSTLTTTPASVEGWTLDVQMSPKKALRAAMLKSRFADTIYRATHQGQESDPSRMQQERERLERKQLEEKARIEAQIKAAEAASRRREQDVREKEREAARMALEKMEKTVEIDENTDVMKELEMLCCSPLSVSPDGRGGESIRHRSPLEQLGLYIKDDSLEEDEDAILEGEEGEILS